MNDKRMIMSEEERGERRKLSHENDGI